MSFLALILWAVLPAAAQTEPAPELLTPSSSVLLGEPLTVQAHAQLGPGQALALDLQRSTTDSLAVTGVRPLPGPGRFEIQVVPLDVGQRSFPLYWTLTSAGSARSLVSQLRLEVREPPEAAQAREVQDIKPPRAARPRLWPFLLLLAVIAAAWYWGWRRKRRLEAQAPAGGLAADARPPEMIALEELTRLEASGLWGEGRHKEFYGTLTEIVRRYLERRYGFAATRETTTEILRRLRATALERQLLQVFKDLFDRADLVKFSKLPAQESWGGSDLDAARRLVTQTSPHEVAGVSEARP